MTNSRRPPFPPQTSRIRIFGDLRSLEGITANKSVKLNEEREDRTHRNQNNPDPGSGGVGDSQNLRSLCHYSKVGSVYFDVTVRLRGDETGEIIMTPDYIHGSMAASELQFHLLYHSCYRIHS